MLTDAFCIFFSCLFFFLDIHVGPQSVTHCSFEGKKNTLRRYYGKSCTLIPSAATLLYRIHRRAFGVSTKAFTSLTLMYFLFTSQIYLRTVGLVAPLFSLLILVCVTSGKSPIAFSFFELWIKHWEVTQAVLATFCKLLMNPFGLCSNSWCDTPTAFSENVNGSSYIKHVQRIFPLGVHHMRLLFFFKSYL